MFVNKASGGGVMHVFLGVRGDDTTPGTGEKPLKRTSAFLCSGGMGEGRHNFVEGGRKDRLRESESEREREGETDDSGETTFGYPPIVGHGLSTKRRRLRNTILMFCRSSFPGLSGVHTCTTRGAGDLASRSNEPRN